MSDHSRLPREPPPLSPGPGQRHPIIVIGVGNPWRRDDGIGHAAIAQLSESALGDGVDLATTDGELTRLIELWQHRRLAIVIDAVVAGAAPGTVHRLDATVDVLPDRLPMMSSHRCGLAEAVALARTLDRLPDRLLVLGIEPEDTGVGPDLSPSASTAMTSLLAGVRAAVHSARVGPSPPTAARREGSCT